MFYDSLWKFLSWYLLKKTMILLHQLNFESIPVRPMHSELFVLYLPLFFLNSFAAEYISLRFQAISRSSYCRNLSYFLMSERIFCFFNAYEIIKVYWIFLTDCFKYLYCHGSNAFYFKCM